MKLNDKSITAVKDKTSQKNADRKQALFIKDSMTMPWTRSEEKHRRL